MISGRCSPLPALATTSRSMLAHFLLFPAGANQPVDALLDQLRSGLNLITDVYTR